MEEVRIECKLYTTEKELDKILDKFIKNDYFIINGAEFSSDNLDLSNNKLYYYPNPKQPDKFISSEIIEYTLILVSNNLDVFKFLFFNESEEN